MDLYKRYMFSIHPPTRPLSFEANDCSFPKQSIFSTGASSTFASASPSKSTSRYPPQLYPPPSSTRFIPKGLPKMTKLSKKPASTQANADTTQQSSGPESSHAVAGSTDAKHAKRSVLGSILERMSGKGKEKEKEKKRETSGWAQMRHQQQMLAEQPQPSGPSSAIHSTFTNKKGETQRQTFPNGVMNFNSAEHE